jgi:hypothetical protein
MELGFIESFKFLLHSNKGLMALNPNVSLKHRIKSWKYLSSFSAEGSTNGLFIFRFELIKKQRRSFVSKTSV